MERPHSPEEKKKNPFERLAQHYRLSMYRFPSRELRPEACCTVSPVLVCPCRTLLRKVPVSVGDVFHMLENDRLSIVRCQTESQGGTRHASQISQAVGRKSIG